MHRLVVPDFPCDPLNVARRPAAASIFIVGCIFASFVVVNSATARQQAATACSSSITFGAIPTWARSGFSGSQKMHYVLGRRRSIAGLLFAYPLSSPPSQGEDNKILWVSKRPDASGAALHIEAVRMIGTREVGKRVQRVVAHGPGPSIINLPHAGCWRFTLAWAGKQDTLDLRYLAG
jgi:hypothetical protein